MKATPGPWVAESNLGCKTIKGGKRGDHRQAQYIEVASTPGLYDETEDAANARLIAAAPDLYEALADLIDEIETDGGVDTSEWPLLDAARAAIARAEGT